MRAAMRLTLNWSVALWTRAERIAQLTEEGKFDPETDSPIGLPKVAVKHSKAGQKTKKEEKPAEAAEGAAEGAEGAAEAEGDAGDDG